MPDNFDISQISQVDCWQLSHSIVSVKYFSLQFDSKNSMLKPILLRTLLHTSMVPKPLMVLFLYNQVFSIKIKLLPNQSSYEM